MGSFRVLSAIMGGKFGFVMGAIVGSCTGD